MKAVVFFLCKCFFLIFLSVSVCWASDGWSGIGTISAIRVYNDDFVLVQMPGALNPGSCSTTSYMKLPQEPGNVAQIRQYTTLMSAYLNGKSVNLALTGCSSGGTEGFPVIEQVWLQ